MNKNKNKPTDRFNNHSVINAKAALYTNKTMSIDGKRQNKRTCIYYDVNTEHCNNKRCSKSICTTAHNCTGYRRKEKDNKSKKELSLYDESYIILPYKPSIHESDNRYIGISKNIGTPVHCEYLESDGMRRHKARCIYYDKINKLCKWFMQKCIGSSHCDRYKER